MAEFRPTGGESLMNPCLERTFRGHKNFVTSVSFSPNLTKLASGSGDNTVMMWNFKPQLRAFRYIGHTEKVNDVTFSPTGDVLASASKDRTVRLWIPSAKGESVVMKGHTGPVRSVRFSNDGKLLITASDDKLVKIWSLPSRRFLCSLSGHSNWVQDAKFSPDNKLAVSGGEDKLVKLWDVETHQNTYTFHDHNDHVNKVSFNVDGNSIMSCSDDKSIKVWDLRSHQLIQHYTAHSQAVTSISVHASGNYMLSSSKDSSIRVWDIREGRLLYTLQGHTGAVNTVSFSPDGNFFSSGGVDQLVMVWKSNLLGIVPEDWEKEKCLTETQRRATTSSPPRPKKVSASTSLKAPNLTEGVLKARGKDNAVKSSVIPGAASAAAPLSRPVPPMVEIAGMNDKDLYLSVPGAPDLIARDTLPAPLVNTLDHIVGQLSLIGRTMAILEQRLTLTENRLAGLSATTRGIHPMLPEDNEISAEHHPTSYGEEVYESEDEA